MPRLALAAGGGSPNEKLQRGPGRHGGRGLTLVQWLNANQQVNLVAFCDVDETYAAGKLPGISQGPAYTDYRKMYDEMDRQIDAVVVSTPDHHHYPASMMAYAASTSTARSR